MRKNCFLLLLALILVVDLSAVSGKETTDSRLVTILAVNDVYRLDELPYLRSLRSKLEKNNGNVLLLHAGDFLFPSLLSRKYNGEQMVDVLNYLDGDKKAFDPYMFITFGNHEFDKSKLQHAHMLQKRIRESQFTWLNSNVIFRKKSKERFLVQAEQMLPSKIVTVNGVRVGLLGVVTNIKTAEYIDRFLSPEQVLRDGVIQLRQKGAEVVIALTHLSMRQDKALLKSLGDDAPDLIIGGHEHDRQTVLVNGRRIVKADSDAKTIAVVQVRPNKQNAIPDVQLEYVELPGSYDSVKEIQQRSVHWKKRFNTEFCRQLGESSDCLDQALGKTQVELIAEELTIRRFETNLGNWLTDLARERFVHKGAQIAFLNSGGMRLNKNLPAGSVITRRHLYTLFAYPARLVMIRLTGAQLQQVINHSVSDWTGSGHWLQVSGFTYKHDPENAKASNLHLITTSGLKPILPEDEILAVVNYYLINEKGDRDGYGMLGSSLLVEPHAQRPNLMDFVIEDLQRNWEQGVSPRRDGRICNVRDRLDCLLK